MVRLLFALLVFIIASVQSKKLCDLGNVELTTSGSRNVYNAVMRGVPSLFGPSDPLYLKQLKAKTPSVNYTVSDLTLAGLSSCNVVYLKLDEKKLTNKFKLQCPQIILNYHYAAKGVLGPVEIDANTRATVTLDDYAIELKGFYGKFTSEKDHENHFYLKEYTLDFELKGNVKIDVKDSLHSDPVKSQLAKAYVLENSRDLEPYVRSPTIETCMAQVINKIDIYLRNYPDYEILPAE